MAPHTTWYRYMQQIPINDRYSMASILETVRRISAKSREVLKPRHWMLWSACRYEIWQASRRRCCRGASHFLERLEKFKPESRGFDTSWDLEVRRLSAYWIEACGNTSESSQQQKMVPNKTTHPVKNVWPFFSNMKIDVLNSRFLWYASA